MTPPELARRPRPPLPLTGARMQLACRHWIAWPAEKAPPRADGWYGAEFCTHCGRRRAVVCASFSKPT